MWGEFVLPSVQLVTVLTHPRCPIGLGRPDALTWPPAASFYARSESGPHCRATAPTRGSLRAPWAFWL